MSLMSQKVEGGDINSFECITHLVPFITVIMYFSPFCPTAFKYIPKMQYLQF